MNSLARCWVWAAPCEGAVPEDPVLLLRADCALCGPDHLCSGLPRGAQQRCMRLQTRKDSQNPELCHSHLVFFDWKPYLQISCFCTLIKHPPTHLHSRLLLKFAVPRGLGGDLDWSPNLTNGILVWGVRGGRKAPQGAKNNNFFCPKWGRWSVSGVFPCRSSSI